MACIDQRGVVDSLCGPSETLSDNVGRLLSERDETERQRILGMVIRQMGVRRGSQEELSDIIGYIQEISMKLYGQTLEISSSGLEASLPRVHEARPEILRIEGAKVDEEIEVEYQRDDKETQTCVERRDRSIEIDLVENRSSSGGQLNRPEIPVRCDREVGCGQGRDQDWVALAFLVACGVSYCVSSALADISRDALRDKSSIPQLPPVDTLESSENHDPEMEKEQPPQSTYRSNPIEVEPEIQLPESIRSSIDRARRCLKPRSKEDDGAPIFDLDDAPFDEAKEIIKRQIGDFYYDKRRRELDIADNLVFAAYVPASVDSSDSSNDWETEIRLDIANRIRSPREISKRPKSPIVLKSVTNNIEPKPDPIFEQPLKTEIDRFAFVEQETKEKRRQRKRGLSERSPVREPKERRFRDNDASVCRKKQKPQIAFGRRVQGTERKTLPKVTSPASRSSEQMLRLQGAETKVERKRTRDCEPQNLPRVYELEAANESDILLDAFLQNMRQPIQDYYSVPHGTSDASFSDQMFLPIDWKTDLGIPCLTQTSYGPTKRSDTGPWMRSDSNDAFARSNDISADHWISGSMTRTHQENEGDDLFRQFLERIARKEVEASDKLQCLNQRLDSSPHAQNIKSRSMPVPPIPQTPKDSSIQCSPLPRVKDSPSEGRLWRPTVDFYKECQSSQGDSDIISVTESSQSTTNSDSTFSSQGRQLLRDTAKWKQFKQRHYKTQNRRF